MELVRGALDIPPHDYAIDARLREIAYGTWEGSTLAEAQIADPVAVCPAPVGKMDGVGAGRRKLCRRAAAGE